MLRWGGVVVATACMVLVALSGAALADKDDRNVSLPAEGPTPPSQATTAPAVPGIEAALDRLQQSQRLAGLAIDWSGLKSIYAGGTPALWVTPTGYSVLGSQLLQQVPKAAAAGMPVAAEIQSALAMLPAQLSPDMPADAEALMSAVYIAGAYDATGRLGVVSPGIELLADLRSAKDQSRTIALQF